MRYLILILVLLPLSCASDPSTIEEARERFYEEIEEAREQPCIPENVQEAYQNLVDLVYEIPDDDSTRHAEQWEIFVGQDEQTMEHFKTGVCDESLEGL